MIRFLFKLCVSLGLLAVLVWHIDLGVLRGAFSRVGWIDMLAATLLIIATTPLLAWRWIVVARAIGVPLTGRSALVIVLIGMYFNQVLPSSIGGDAVRVWLLRSTQVSLTKSLSSILLDRVIALAGMVLIVAAGYPWLMDIVRRPTLQSAVAAAVGCTAIGMATLLSFDRIPLPAAARSNRYVNALLGLAADARRVLLSPRIAAPALAASVALYLAASVAIWIISRSIGLSVGLEAFALLLPIVLLVSLLPISIAGWGVRESAMIVCLGLVGVDSGSAFAVSTLFGLTGVLAGLPGGVVWILVGRKRGAGG